jgi:cysteine desulfuration protein SufE
MNIENSDTKTLEQKEQIIIDEFLAVPDWEARYRKIIEIGKALPELAENLKTEESKVKGCQSQVWLHASLSPKRRLRLMGDSDAMIVRGLVALILRVYDNSTPEEILQSTPKFLSDLGFAQNLSPSRANGLNAMIKQIHRFAYVYSVSVPRAFWDHSKNRG